MTQEVNQATTQLTSIDPRIEAPLRRRLAIPTLTIAYHPVLRRIGDRALLSELMVGRDAKVSRTMPRFAPPHREPGMTLDDAHISRRPFVLRRHPGGGLTLIPGETRTHIAVDGARVTGEMHISVADLDSGVLLELAERVALLLHMHTPHDARETGDLGLVGHSTGIRRVRDDIRQVAGFDIPVLVRGETGSGKELVASAIHDASQRSAHRLVSVNLAALPASLAAAELFGVVRGAFTGAARNQEGYFRRAHASTLFLDEIGEVPVDVQAMLLRALETGEIYALGAQRAERVDVRVIAATDADLERLIARGDFRAPLLHRLAGYEIHVPPLRERRDDIPSLLLHFLGLELAEFGKTERLDQVDPLPWLPMPLVTSLVRYDWPGNVRQLRNTARQLVIANRDCTVAEVPTPVARQLGYGNAICISTRAAGDLASRRTDQAEDSAICNDGERDKRRHRKPSEISDAEIAHTLRAHRWDIKATAAALHISRTSLYNLIRSSDHLRTAGDLTVEEIQASFVALAGDLDAMVEHLRVSRNALRRRIKELGMA